MTKAEQMKLFQTMIDNENLTTGHLKAVLIFLTEKDVTTKKVAERLNVSLQYACKLVKKLEQEGIVEPLKQIPSTRIIIYGLSKIEIIKDNAESK